MSEEKKKIMEMIQEGKITAAEGLDLLQALEEGEIKTEIKPSRFKNRFLRIRVYTANATKVNVNIPLALMKAASKFVGVGMKAIPEEARLEMAKKGIDLTQLDIEELMNIIEQGLVEGDKIVDIDVNDPVEGQVRVEVYVD